MKIDETIEIEIERMSFGPAAVGRVAPDGQEDSPKMVVFVEGAAPGERVAAKLRKQHKNYWEATLVRVLRPSADRIEPPCPVFDRCGGCQWQHLSYPAQLAAKEEVLLHQLARATRIPRPELRAMLRVHGAQSPFGYRSRVQARGDARGLGFFASGSHSLVHTDRCLVAHEDIQRAWTEFIRTRPLAELAAQTGQFKVEWSRTEAGQVGEAINRKHAALGFTQINREQNEVLARIVAEAAGSGALLLDLYGGNGNLSNALTQSFGHIVSVDDASDGEAPSALRGALAPGRVFVRQKIEEFIIDQRWRDWGFERIDCLIADPPRAGLSGIAQQLANLRAGRVVLVSCDPSTLARDVTAFLESYRIASIDLVDMFPQTYHLECVVSFSGAP